MKAGAGRIALPGFSRGRQQAAWHAARQPQPRLERLVLLAPIFAGDLPRRHEARFGAPLQPLLQRARPLAARCRDGEVLAGVGFLNCERACAGADSPLSYYDPAPDGEPAATLPAIRVPSSLVVAGGDTVVRNLPQRVGAAVDGGRLRMTASAGADRSFRDLYGEDAADAIDAFLRE